MFLGHAKQCHLICQFLCTRPLSLSFSKRTHAKFKFGECRNTTTTTCWYSLHHTCTELRRPLKSQVSSLTWTENVLWHRRALIVSGPNDLPDFLHFRLKVIHLWRQGNLCSDWIREFLQPDQTTKRHTRATTSELLADVDRSTHTSATSRHIWFGRALESTYDNSELQSIHIYMAVHCGLIWHRCTHMGAHSDWRPYVNSFVFDCPQTTVVEPV